MKLQETFVATSGNTSKKFHIEDNVQKLLIIRTFTSGGNTAGKLITAMPEHVSLEITGLGSSRLSQGERIPLGHMAIFAQFGEGVVHEEYIGGVTRQFIPVVLASIGVNLGPGDTSHVLLEQCVVGASYEVYAIQTPQTGNLVYEYLLRSVLAGDRTKKILVEGVTNVILPVKGLEKVVAYYRGAGTCTYTPIELRFMNAELNDIENMQYNHETDVSNVFGSMSSEGIVMRTELLEKFEVFTDNELYEYVTISEIDRNAR